MNELPFDSLHEECGVFGVFGVDDAPGIVYYGLHALQHRGRRRAASSVPRRAASRRSRARGW